MNQDTAFDRRTLLLERLKVFPDLTPPETAMAARAAIIPLQIAGIRLDFVTRSPDLAQRLRHYFADFLGEGPATARLRAENLRSALWEDPDPEFDVRGCHVIQRDFAALRTSDAPHEAIAWLSPGLDDSFHNLLRWFLPPLLLQHQAFLLHGAGVVRDGKGYVFFGHSEAGKSTSVALISQSDPQTTILGDDGIMIQMKEGIPHVLAAPLGCGYSREAPPAVCAPLVGLFALQQDLVDRIDLFTPSQAITQLLASVMSVHFNEDIDQRFDLATRFAAKPGIAQLRFRKDPAFWLHLRDNF